MLIAKLSLFTLTRTFIKCKPLCDSDGGEEAENPAFYPYIDVATMHLLLFLVKYRYLSIGAASLSDNERVREVVF